MNHKLLYQKLSYSTVLLLTAVVFAGCGTSSPRPTPWALAITKTTPASIQIDLIGVTENEKPYWEGYNLDKYWTEGDRRRAEANKLTKTLQMGQKWSIPMDDPKWKDWLNRGDTELLVIANLPGTFEPGPSDPRRIFLPLDKHAWKAKNHTLEIQVQDTLISVLTPQTIR